MRMLYRLAIAIAITVDGPEAAELGETTFETEATSSYREYYLDDGSLVRHFVTNSFVSFNYYDSTLYRQTVDTKDVLSREDTDSWCTVSAWKRRGDGFPEKLWEVHDVGDKIDYSSDWLTFTKYGCCTAVDTYLIFNLRNGKKLFTTTSGFASVTVDELDVKRLIGFHLRESSVPYTDTTLDDHRDIGMIIYCDDTTILQIVLVLWKEYDLWPMPDVLLTSDVFHQESQTLNRPAHADWPPEKALSGFDVTIRFWKGREIRIPVDGDRLVIDKASMPKGVELIELES